MNRRRLNRLADHLDSVPRRGFDMTEWIRPAKDSEEWATIAQLKKADTNDYTCGMAACVGGHAALLFPRVLTIIALQPQLVGQPALNNTLVAYERIGHVLGLCPVHAEFLCSPDAAHTTPKKAARAIRALLALSPECCDGR